MYAEVLQAGVDLRLRAIASSRRMALEDTAMDPASAAARLRADDAQACDLDAFAAHVRAGHLPHAMIVDCSASDAVAAKYADWLAAGIHVVTPNKHAGSGDWARYTAITEARREGSSRFLYEATVGAGLPVVLTLRNLIDTGDTLHAIDGMLSGTLAWLFNSFDGRRPFSELVREARALGYTEPDPRLDLSGEDVRRKLLILARSSGLALDASQVQVDSLVPETLAALPLEGAVAALEQLDAPLQARWQQARKNGRVLRFVGRVDGEGAQVGLRELPADHPLAQGAGTDNRVAIHSDRYRRQPLLIQGPGAGAEVTAAALLDDVLRIVG